MGLLRIHSLLITDTFHCGYTMMCLSTPVDSHFWGLPFSLATSIATKHPCGGLCVKKCLFLILAKHLRVKKEACLRVGITLFCSETGFHFVAQVYPRTD